MIDVLFDGLERLRRKDYAWVQLDVATPGLSAAAIAAAVVRVADDLSALVAESPARRPIGRWWFIRKNPGVRVRIEIPDKNHTSSTAALSALSVLGPTTISEYEAERYRFGGDDGMDIAHDQFALDSTLTVLRERMNEPPIQWSAWLLDDLSRRLTDDAAEAWDSWKRLEEVLESAIGAHIAQEFPISTSADDQAARQVKSAAERGHSVVARRLRQASLGHGVGRRTWFGAVAIFHWNRLALTPREMQRVVSEVISRFNCR